ncbi:hypothetical protein HUK49_04805 [Limosilactobacillus sp. c11Ua_112_M]|uniref:hypothetical protein n=1 Tax=Limosilactobacillus TaxID=2742598 RepID=UPI0017851399|nr:MULTISPECIES: hypothetical protein [Limosilactobacillus]MBD8087276.1 hypothetical protein [Limosilactobacillus portuensis]MEC4741756.1 hypothetical protein [Limosilactobacillus sp. c10Ua_36]
MLKKTFIFYIVVIRNDFGDFFIYSLSDFKRIYSIASLMLAGYNIFDLQKSSSIDLIVLMFMVSNILTVVGAKFSKRWNTKRNNRIRKFIEYTIAVLFFAILIDDSNSILINYVSLTTYRIIYFLILLSTFLYCIIISFFLVNQQELEKEIKESAKTLVKSFDDAVKQFSNEVDDLGGWSEFIKTDVGHQFAEEVKARSKIKTPTDYRKHKRKKR